MGIRVRCVVTATATSRGEMTPSLQKPELFEPYTDEAFQAQVEVFIHIGYDAR
jgi:hypothetical protein